MCDISSKLTLKTPERRQWSRSGVFIANFELISHIALCFHYWLLASKGWLGLRYWMRYLARNKFSESLVHKKNFELIWRVVFMLDTYFIKGGGIPPFLLSLNKLGKKSHTTIILVDFVNKPKSNFYWPRVFRK